MSIRYLTRIDPFLVFVTMIGGLLRLYRPGLPPIKYDEINALFWTNRIVEAKEWIWVSNNYISWGSNATPFANHSPFTNYVLILPVFLSDDPIFSRVFVALIGVLSVALFYVIMRRFFGTSAAISAGLIYAVAPMAVEWSRFAWNPSIAAPLLVVGWIGATLLGYQTGIRWARWLSWVLLGLSLQTHPANILLGASSELRLLAH